MRSHPRATGSSLEKPRSSKEIPLLTPCARIIGMLVVVSVLTLAVREALAAPMYTVTELTPLAGSKLNDNG